MTMATTSIHPMVARIDNPANEAEPYQLTTTNPEIASDYTRMALDINLSLNKATLADVLDTEARATISAIGHRAIISTKGIIMRLPLEQRPADSVYTTAGNVAATRILARETAGTVQGDQCRTIDDYQPPSDISQKRDWKNVTLWPARRPTSSVPLYVYATTRASFDRIVAGGNLSAAAQDAIAFARLGEWGRSMLAAVAAARIITTDLQQRVDADYWVDVRTTTEAWVLADKLVNTLNRRVTGQSAAQRAVTTAFFRKVFVDRYQSKGGSCSTRRTGIRGLQHKRRGSGENSGSHVSTTSEGRRDDVSRTTPTDGSRLRKRATGVHVTNQE